MQVYSRLAGPTLGLVALLLSACASTPGPSSAGASSAQSAPVSSPTPIPTAAVVLFTCDDRAVTWDGKSPLDLTGAWAADDAGVYYIRQIGDAIWWTGMSGLGEPLDRTGKDWTNVFTGKATGLTVTGTYADVPRGDVLLDGPVTVELRATASGGPSLVRTTPDADTEFGGKVLTPCTPS